MKSLFAGLVLFLSLLDKYLSLREHFESLNVLATAYEIECPTFMQTEINSKDYMYLTPENGKGVRD